MPWTGHPGVFNDDPFLFEHDRKNNVTIEKYAQIEFKPFKNLLSSIPTWKDT